MRDEERLSSDRLAWTCRRHTLAVASDSQDQPKHLCLYVDTPGTLTVVDEAGVEVSYNADKGLFYFQAKRIKTSTSAVVYLWS